MQLALPKCAVTCTYRVQLRRFGGGCLLDGGGCMGGCAWMRRCCFFRLSAMRRFWRCVSGFPLFQCEASHFARSAHALAIRFFWDGLYRAAPDACAQPAVF